MTIEQRMEVLDEVRQQANLSGADLGRAFVSLYENTAIKRDNEVSDALVSDDLFETIVSWQRDINERAVKRHRLK